MTSDTLLLLLAVFPSLVMDSTLPASWTMNAQALWTMAVLTAVSPLSAIWIISTATLSPILMHLAERTHLRGMITGIWTVILVGALFSSREWTGILWIGGAYFTLRNLHVMYDWWMGQLENPGVIRHLRYQLFLPVIVAGPIHRFQNFERQLIRRRWSGEEFLTGAERVLFGLALLVVIGGLFLDQILDPIKIGTADWPIFFRFWLISAGEWIHLYFSFAGLTAIALGFSLMMGMRLEENFNRPWLATDLVDFWTRWHITLSLWCRDYVFQPVSALTRVPLLGLFAAMLAIGLWHETSLYYVLWSFWQALGIFLSRAFSRPLSQIMQKSRLLHILFGPVVVLGWLSLAKPVIYSLFIGSNL